MLKSSDGNFFAVAKIIERDGLCKIVFDELKKDCQIAVFSGSLAKQIENGEELEEIDLQNFCVAMIENDSVIAQFKQGTAKADLDKLKKSRCSSCYDDEQISDFNYYDNRLIGEVYEKQSACDTDATMQSQLAEPTQKDYVPEPQEPDDKDSDSCQKTASTPYYLKKYEQIERIFCSGRKERRLEKVVLNSRFYELDYADCKHYVFGVIYDGENPKYLTYGIKGNFYDKPLNFKGYNCFVPLSLLNLRGDGYYLIFQDAINGLTFKENICQF